MVENGMSYNISEAVSLIWLLVDFFLFFIVKFFFFFFFKWEHVWSIYPYFPLHLITIIVVVVVNTGDTLSIPKTRI